jgi:hypothetical protein
MENRIEQEINDTLRYLDKNPDIGVSSSFVGDVSSRIAGMRISRGGGYRSRRFYPVVIVLLIALNLVTGLVALKGQQSTSAISNINQGSVLASEYGIGQNSNTDL